MNAKALLLFALLATARVEAQCTTTVTLATTTNTSLTISNGQVAKIVSAFITGQLNVFLGTNFSIPFVTYSSGAQMPFPVVISGPAMIYLVNTGNGAFCTVTLDTPCASFTPSTAVVIPADSGGPVNIILESSVDLITWNAALPGTYGTSTTNRFFRVRAQRSQ